jgi:hypothetical protein
MRKRLSFLSSAEETSACGGGLNAGARCTISVTFRPTSAAGSSQAATLAGTGH